MPRTVGVSTTELVGRMLLMTRDHHEPQTKKTKDEEPAKKSPYTAGSKMMPSNHRLVQFSQPIREPKKDDKIVYVDGGFDLFRTIHFDELLTIFRYWTCRAVQTGQGQGGLPPRRNPRRLHH